MAALRLIILAILCLPWLCTNALAQCCSAGSPVGGTSNLGIMTEGKSKLIVNYSFSYSDQFFNGSKRVDPLFLEEVYFNLLRLNLTHGLTERLSVEADAAYFHSALHGPGILPDREQNHGVSDLALTFHYNVYRDLGRRWEVTTGAGVKYTTGSLKQTYRGSFVTVTETPSTATPDFIHSLFIYRRFPARGLQFFLSNRIEFRGRDKDSYRYGNLYATSFFTSYNLSLKWNGILQVRSEIRERDARSGRKLILTGSRKLFLVPQLSYSLSSSLILTVLVDVPIYQHYNEQQIGSALTAGFAIIKKLGSDKLVLPTPSN